MKDGRMILGLRLTALASLALTALTGTAIYLLFEKHNPLGQLRYYTLQSNILVAAAAIAEIVLLLRSKPLGRGFGGLRIAAVIAIMVTGIIYSIFLAGAAVRTPAQVVANILCHYASPILAPIVWLAFAEKGVLSLKQAPLWLAFPLAYVVYALVQGWLTGFYPYWFLNPIQARPQGIGSIWGVLGFVGIVSAAFVLIGALLVGVDRILKKKPKAASESLAA